MVKYPAESARDAKSLAGRICERTDRNDTLRRILDDPEAMAAVERIEGWRALDNNVIKTIINKSEKIKELEDKTLTDSEKTQLTEEEKE